MQSKPTKDIVLNTDYIQRRIDYFKEKKQSYPGNEIAQEILDTTILFFEDLIWYGKEINQDGKESIH